MSKTTILIEVSIERQRQDSKWGDQREHGLDHWNTILTKETGEFAKAILENDYAEVRRELVQVAAVAVCILEYLDRKSPAQPTEEETKERCADDGPCDTHPHCDCGRWETDPNPHLFPGQNTAPFSAGPVQPTQEEK